MDLVEYLPIPYQISKDHLLEIKPEQRMLAVDKRNSMYRQMSALDLLSCTKIKHLYYCKTGNTFYRSSEKSCLFSLYTRNMVDIEEHCPVQIEVNTDRLIQMSNKELIIYHHKKQSVQHHCLASESHDDSISFSGFKQFYLHPGCRVTSPKFMAEGSVDLFYHSDEVVETDLHFLDHKFTFNFSDKVDDKLINTLNEVGSRKGLHIRDIKQLLKSEERGFHVKIGLVGIVVLILILIVCGCLCKIFGCRKVLLCGELCCKNSVPPPVSFPSAPPAIAYKALPTPMATYRPPVPQTRELTPANADVNVDENEIVRAPFMNPAGRYNAMYRDVRFANPEA